MTFFDFVLFSTCLAFLCRLYFVVVMEMPDSKPVGVSSVLLGIIISFILAGLLTTVKISLAYTEFIEQAYIIEELETPTGESLIKITPIPFFYEDHLSLWSRLCWLITHSNFDDLKDFRIETNDRQNTS